MQLRKHRRRHHTLSYAALSFLVFGITMPIVIGSRMDRLAFSDAAALSAMSDSYSLGAPLPLVQSAGILLERGTISVSKAQAANTRTSEELLNLLASGNARLVLDNSAVAFTSAAEVAAVSPPIDAAAPLIATLLGSRFDSLRINHGMISIPHVHGRKTIDLSDVNADISLRRAAAISAKGTFVFNRKTVAFEATIGLGDGKAAQRLPVSATLKSDLVRASLDGRVTLGTGLQISASSPQLSTPSLRELAAWLGYEWPIKPGFESFKATGNFDLADSNVSLQQATLLLDGNEATGALFLTFDRDQPTLDATLAMRRLDLAPYLTSNSQTGSDVGWREVLRAAGLVGLPILSNLVADLRLSAERVTVGSAVLGRGAATLTARQGNVIADIAELELDGGGGGTMQLSFDNNRRAPAYTLRAKMRGFEFADPLPLPASGVPLLAGRGEISADIAATGGTIDDLVGSLSGHVRLSMPRGGQAGLDLAALMASPPASETAAPVAGWRTAADSATAVEDLGLRFHIANGLWTVESARARAGNAIFLATGSVYPPTRSLDVRVSRSNGLVPVAADAPAGAPAAKMVGVQGPWAAPRVAPIPRLGRAAEPVPDAVPAPAPGAPQKLPPGRG